MSTQCKYDFDEITEHLYSIECTIPLKEKLHRMLVSIFSITFSDLTCGL